MDLERFFFSLCSDYEVRIYRYFLFRWRLTPSEAEDLTQDTFLKAWKSLPSFRDHHIPEVRTAWIFRICARVASSYVGNRSSKPGETSLPDSLPAPTRPEQIHARLQIDLFLRQADPSTQEIFLLHYIAGLSEPEIAKTLGINPHTLHTRLARIREAARSFFKP